MNVQTLVFSEDSASVTPSPNPAPCSGHLVYSERLATVAKAVIEGTRGHFAEVSVTGEAGEMLVGRWLDTEGYSTGLRCVVRTVLGRRVTMRIDDAGTTDATLLTIVAETAGLIAARGHDNSLGLVMLEAVIGPVASALGRSVILQDAYGREVTASASISSRLTEGAVDQVYDPDTTDMCRTWPLSWRNYQVGRLWLAPGRRLNPFELGFLMTSRQLLSATLAD